MKVPNAERALVEQEKLTDYLLNLAHPDNGGKAQFFFSAGFTKGDWHILAMALRQLIEQSPVTIKVESPHGIKYVIDGKIMTPREETRELRTIWIVDTGENIPRLVPAYPKAR